MLLLVGGFVQRRCREQLDFLCAVRSFLAVPIALSETRQRLASALFRVRCKSQLRQLPTPAHLRLLKRFVVEGTQDEVNIAGKV